MDSVNFIEQFNHQHGLQDYRSFVLNIAAVSLIAKQESDYKKALVILNRWMLDTSHNSYPLFVQWYDLLVCKNWEVMLEVGQKGRQLRQASPIGCVLPHKVRFALIKKANKEWRSHFEKGAT